MTVQTNAGFEYADADTYTRLLDSSTTRQLTTVGVGVLSEIELPKYLDKSAFYDML